MWGPGTAVAGLGLGGHFDRLATFSGVSGSGSVWFMEWWVLGGTYLGLFWVRPWLQCCSPPFSGTQFQPFFSLLLKLLVPFPHWGVSGSPPGPWGLFTVGGLTLNLGGYCMYECKNMFTVCLCVCLCWVLVYCCMGVKVGLSEYD